MSDAVVGGDSMPAFIEVLGGSSAGLIIGLTPKGGCTSMRSSIRSSVGGMCWSVQDLRENQKPVRVYLRHPLTRFASCWTMFSDSDKFPRSLPQVPPRASLETFTDYVLNGAENDHWIGQLYSYQGCNIAEVYRFEDIDHTWPDDIPLLHLNAAQRDKPEIIYRRAELEDYYDEDLEAWCAL